MTTFSEALKADRIARKISQQQLARDLKIVQQSLSKWENGQTRPRDYKMAKIAEYFGPGSLTWCFFAVRYPKPTQPKPQPKPTHPKPTQPVPSDQALALAVRVGALTYAATKALQLLEDPDASHFEADRVAALLREILGAES